MQGRIEIETMDLKGENDQITTEIKEIIKDSSLLKICGYKIFYILFSPKGIVELLILFLTMAALKRGTYSNEAALSLRSRRNGY